MNSVYDLELPEIDIFSPDYASDPHGCLAEARKHHWLAKYPMGFMVLDQQGIIDINRADADMRTPLKDIVSLFGAEDTAWGKWSANHLVAMDYASEDYQRIRRIIAPAFTPKEANKSRDVMVETINELLDGVVAGGEIDFSKSVGSKYPITSLCKIIGFPVEDVSKIEEWVILQNEGYGMDPGIVPVLDAGVREQQPYVRGIIEARMQPGDHPDDLVQKLVDLARAGEAMSVEELESLLMLLLGGGYDSTKQALNMCIYMMARHPQEAEKLAQDPARCKRFIEETLRLMGVAGATHRVARHEFTYRDVVFQEGTFISLPHLFAGRDPAVHEDPDTFNPDRKKFNHTQFGQGAHMCIGMFLAKAELEEALKVIVQRMKNIRLAAEPEFDGAMGFWGFTKLPITFDAVV